MNTPEIRFAAPGDIDTLVEYCGLHAAFERASYSPEGKAARLLEHLTADPPSLHCLVAEQGGKLLGYATYMRQFSTWDALHYLYLDCLYLTEDARGHGLGRRFMERIREEAHRLGIEQIQWQTPEFNSSAIAFYGRLGASPLSKERFTWSVPRPKDA